MLIVIRYAIIMLDLQQYVTNESRLIITGAARGLLNSRHLGVKITNFTDFHPILSVFQQYLRKLGHYFIPKRPQEPPLNS